ncbi:S-methyl-5-thioribose-1-phosphate isomerase [Thermogemmatispora sp.]|uniref:S-methyl-5-thioribose-1-phosphate isomerase n=1 Tax=Thermogemmatispora sp. TaxID=1968838 RepID=UPI0035E43BF2
MSTVAGRLEHEPEPVQRVRPLWWQEDERGCGLMLLDQTLLPQQVVYCRLEDERQVAEAIKALKVRGAPAIGMAAAFGLVLALRRLLQERGGQVGLADLLARLEEAGALLAATRPTAVNLGWAIRRLLARAEGLAAAGSQPTEIVRLLLEEAQAIAAEDRAACLRMGRYGEALIADGDQLLTHCNTGILATAGWGTALAPMYLAHRAGKRIHVLVDETRPVLQGARLTAWELQQEGVPFTLITDNMAGYFMRQGKVAAVFVGADRIAANGDVANKIGTYSLAVLAQAHGIPFYVVAPCSTIDLDLPSGEEIPIEQRDPREVTAIRGVAIAPDGISVANPAFDVTPHTYISAIITERGVARAPFSVALRGLCANDHHPSERQAER